MEETINRLLPGSATHDRTLLLAELSSYAQAIVCEARRLKAIVPTIEERERAFKWLDQPVFICGHHRSGTTLLQTLLDGHPQLLVLPSEGTYFSSFYYAARPNPLPKEIDRFIADWISRFVDPNHEPHFKLGHSDENTNPSLIFARRLLGWHGVLLQKWPARARFALLLALAAAFRDTAHAFSMPRLWVEKTPLNELYVSRFKRFSRARFIHLVREPGATLASLREIHRSGATGSFDAAEHAWAIGRSLRLARENSRRLKGRYLVVRYEDLASNPGSEMEFVRSFLEIPTNPSLSVPTTGGFAVKSNSSFKSSNAGEIQRPRPSIKIPPADARLISAFTEPSALSFKYEVIPLPWLARSAMQLKQLSLNAPRRIARSMRHAIHPLLRT